MKDETRSTIRVAILADIHSNFAAFEAVVNDAKQLCVDEYIIAGDLVSDWHQPNETVELARKLTPIVIKGNREKYMSEYGIFKDIWSQFDQYASLKWTYETLTKSSLDYITSLSNVMALINENIQIRVVHGSPFRINELMYKDTCEANVKRALVSVNENLLIFGHTHEQWEYRYEDKIAVNPGSVGVHFNKEHKAEYTIIEIKGDKVSVLPRLVSYDLEGYFLEMLRTDMYKKSYVWILVNYLGMIKGENYLLKFLTDVSEERKKHSFSQGGPIPNDIYNKVFEDKYSDLISSYISQL